MKLLTSILSFLFVSAAIAQTAPPLSVGGAIGITGSSSLRGQTNITMGADANYTMVPNEWWTGTIVITSSTSLTATRNIVVPANKGQDYCVENATTGGQSIQIIAASGTGVTVPNSTTSMTCVRFDGTNYIQAGGGLGTLTAAQNTFLGGPCSGGAGTYTFRAICPTDLPTATTSAIGGVQPDSTTITVSPAGVISTVPVIPNGQQLPALYTSSSTSQIAASSRIWETGNSTVSGQESFWPGLIQSGLLPITNRYWSGLPMTCDSTSTCTVTGVDNHDGYFQVGQQITFGAESPNCLISGSGFPIQSVSGNTTNATIVFPTPGDAPGGHCVSLTATIVSMVTNQYVKCAQNGGTLASFLSGGATCTLAQLKSYLLADVAAGVKPLYINRGYLINDVRQDATSFATALSMEKQLFSTINATVPGIPMLMIGENSLLQANDGYIVPASTTVTSGAISAGSNTVTLATMPNSLWAGVGVPLTYKFPNGQPYQVILDNGTGSQETVSLTGITQTTISFTSTLSHAANFTVIATIGTAAQSFSTELHRVTAAMSGFLPNLSTMDMQQEEFGLQSPNSATTPFQYNSLHPDDEGQIVEGVQAAKHLASIPEVSTSLNTVRNGTAYEVLSATSPILVPEPATQSLDSAFTSGCGSLGRLTLFYQSESGCLLAPEDPNYNIPLILGTVNLTTGAPGTFPISGTITINTMGVPSAGLGNGVHAGDKLCVLGSGCMKLATVSFDSPFGSLRLTYTTTETVGPVVTNNLVTVAIYRANEVDMASVPYAQDYNQYPYHMLGTVTSVTSGATSSFTLGLFGGPFSRGINGIAAANLSVQSGDTIVVQGASSPSSAFTINNTTTCSTAADNTSLVCTDTSGTSYSTWSGKQFDVWSQRAPDNMFSNINSTKIVSNGVIVKGLIPTITVAVGATGGSLSNGVTQCYRATSINGLGESLPSNEVCATTALGTSTQYMRATIVPVVGATIYKLYGRTSGAELYMTTLSNTVLSYNDTNTITPSGALPISDASTSGFTGPYSVAGVLTNDITGKFVSTSALSSTLGGLGINTSALTGCPYDTSGVWSVSSGNCATGFYSSIGGTQTIGAVPTLTGTNTATWQVLISGLTTGQIPIAGSSSTITSSKALAGSGSAITSGPVSSTNGDVTTFTGTSGQIQDSGVLLTSLAPLASPTFTGTPSAPTATSGTNTTQIATTAFVTSAISAIPFSVNGTNNTTQGALNFQNSTVNTSGLTLTFSNPSGANVKAEIAGTINAANVPTLNQNTTGNAATATAIVGGSAYQVLQQTGTNITGFVTSPSSAGTYYLTKTLSGTSDVSSTWVASPLSGMTSGQVAIAGSASTITSSKALAGTGSGIVTGPTSATSGDLVSYTGTAGQIADAAIVAANVVTAVSPGAGIAHFAGSTQTLTSSAVNLASSDVTGLLAGANGGLGASLSGTQSPGSVPTITTSGLATWQVVPQTCAGYSCANGSQKAVPFTATSVSGTTTIASTDTTITVSSTTGFPSIACGYISTSVAREYICWDGITSTTLGTPSLPLHRGVFGSAAANFSQIPTIFGIVDSESTSINSVPTYTILSNGTYGINPAVTFAATGNTAAGLSMAQFLQFGRVGAATSSSSFGSAQLQFISSVWNGSTAAVDTFTWATMTGSGTNPTVALTLSATPGSSGVHSVSMPFPTTLGTTTAPQFVSSNGDNLVTYSTTPAFSSSYLSNTITLTGSLTSWTLASGTFGGQPMTLTFCQNSTGGYTSGTKPSNVRGFMTIGTNANTCSSQSFVWSPNLSTPAWLATDAGVINQ